jgi:hypothetical protein
MTSSRQNLSNLDRFIGYASSGIGSLRTSPQIFTAAGWVGSLYYLVFLRRSSKNLSLPAIAFLLFDIKFSAKNQKNGMIIK